MPRESFDRKLKLIQDEILLLGSMVEQAMLQSVEALKRRDITRSKQIYEADIHINDRRYAIENAIIILLATQQPLAHDLRMLAAMLEVNTELERMGDYAKGIAKVTIKLGDSDIQIPVREIEQMSEIAVNMLHLSLSAFIAEDAAKAHNIPLQDDQVDELYNHIYHKMVESMISSPAIIDQANLLMWVAHNIERMADRVTNICERTVFIATGEMLEMDLDDEDEPDQFE